MGYHNVLATGRVPDGLLRRIVRRRPADTSKSSTAPPATTTRRRCDGTPPFSPPARSSIHQDAANRQHYELPTGFFELFLGPRLKYSSCLWPPGVDDLAAAEEAMLELTCERAGIEDGMEVLDLGCGWGSLALFIAERFPRLPGDGDVELAHPGRAHRGRRSPRGHRVGRRRHRRHRHLRPGGASTASSRSRCSSTYATTASSSPGCAAGSRRTVASSSTSSATARFAYTVRADDPRDWMGRGSSAAARCRRTISFCSSTTTCHRGPLVAGRQPLRPHARGLAAALRRACRTHRAAPHRDLRRRRRLGLVGRLAALLPRLRRDVAYDGGREWGVSHYRFAPR